MFQWILTLEIFFFLNHIILSIHSWIPALRKQVFSFKNIFVSYGHGSFFVTSIGVKLIKSQPLKSCKGYINCLFPDMSNKFINLSNFKLLFGKKCSNLRFKASAPDTKLFTHCEQFLRWSHPWLQRFLLSLNSKYKIPSQISLHFSKIDLAVRQEEKSI